MTDATHSPPEITHTTTRAVSCDGGGEPLGHPKIYLHITNTEITCPYCSRRFVLEPGTTDTGH
jgi:uncharacterized Zn-finger protein